MREIAGLGFFGFHERQQIGDRLLHHTRAFDDLRKKHLAGAEEVADHVHAVHQRPFDDGERARILLPRFFNVIVEVLDDPLDERMGKPLLDRAAAPRFFFLRRRYT